ncbi:unnamed protein product, partial [Allacma fusca]
MWWKLSQESYFQEDLKSLRKVILDPRDRYSQLLISHLHEQAAHQGVESVLNEVRVNHWIINARAAVKKAFHNCQK